METRGWQERVLEYHVLLGVLLGRLVTSGSARYDGTDSLNREYGETAVSYSKGWGT